MRLPLMAADALQLPLASGIVDVVTVAFGVRNFESLERGLEELVRVLRPGGTLLVLEFSTPRGAFATMLEWWSRTVPPKVGRLVSGDIEAYTYLPRSVAAFPEPCELTATLRSVGLSRITARPLTGGVATLYEGAKDGGG
jgi:demethylmenaquinone methyltransferase/2-methoxy-6-polyprenyl-1,4-benzoquinol methylase